MTEKIFACDAKVVKIDVTLRAASIGERIFSRAQIFFHFLIYLFIPENLPFFEEQILADSVAFFQKVKKYLSSWKKIVHQSTQLAELRRFMLLLVGEVAYILYFSQQGPPP